MTTTAHLQIKAKREAIGMSLRGLSDHLCLRGAPVSATTLFRWESGDRVKPPSEKALRALASMFELDADEFVLAAGCIPHDIEKALLTDPSIAKVVRSLINNNKG